MSVGRDRALVRASRQLDRRDDLVGRGIYHAQGVVGFVPGTAKDPKPPPQVLRCLHRVT